MIYGLLPEPSLELLSPVSQQCPDSQQFLIFIASEGKHPLNPFQEHCQQEGSQDLVEVVLSLQLLEVSDPKHVTQPKQF